MKLALIRRQYSATGGAELYLQRLLRALGDAGHELHLFAERWQDAPPGVVAHPITLSASRAARPLAFAQAIEREVPFQTFDCVLSFERTLRQDVYRAGDGVHRVWLEQRRRFAPWWRRPFIGWGQFHKNVMALEAQTFDPARTRRVIVNSNQVKQEILKHFSFPEDRIHLIRNGVDLDRYRNGDRAATRARFGFSEHDFVLLFVGSGWERKGLSYLLHAVDRFGIRQGVEILEKELRGGTTPPSRLSRVNIKLLVVGKGKRPYLTSEDYVFAGSMADVENAYAAADLFVFLPIYEPSANVVVEALAAGLPVITSIQNGASELIQEGVNGSVLPDPSDIDAVVDAIGFWSSQRFLARPAETESLRLERNVAETVKVLELAARERSV